jgi:hypothetical protein
MAYKKPITAAKALFIKELTTLKRGREIIRPQVLTKILPFQPRVAVKGHMLFCCPLFSGLGAGRFYSGPRSDGERPTPCL